MPRRFVFVFASVFLIVLISSAVSFAQTESIKPFSRLGIAVKASSLGIGVEAATPLTFRSNLRGGVNLFSYNRTFDEDGISYPAELRFRSVEVHYDWFPFAGGFHISPGVLVYNGNHVAANPLVPGGNTFSLDNNTYTSDPSDPITGNGKIDFIKAGPMFTMGWGNLLPRNHRHFSVPFEFGFVYTGAPRVALNLQGGACDPAGVNCLAITSNPLIQENVQAEKNKLENDISAYRFYPVISVGFGVNF